MKVKKRTSIVIIQLFFIIGISQAQIGLGTTSPNASAVLDITSINKGLLLPRMTTAARNLISNPAKGLLLYNTTTWSVETNSGDGGFPNWSSVSGAKGSNGLEGAIGATGAAGPNLLSVYLPTGFNNTMDGGSSIVLGGYNNKAIGIASGIAGGFHNTTIGGSSFIGGGINNTTQAVSNTIFGGSTNYTNGTNSFIGGGFTNSATGNNSVIVGGILNSISSYTLDATISGGTTNSIVGENLDATISGGANNMVNAINGTISGGKLNKALAISATVSGGIGNQSKSYGEWVGGLYSTNTEPSSATVPIPTDKLFHIGNGTDDAHRSDVLLILKNGEATLPSVTNALLDAGSEKVIITKEYADANFFKFKTSEPASPTDTGRAGEIRITPTFIYTCYEDNKWVRAPSSTYTSETSNATALIESYNCTTSTGVLYEGYVVSGVTQTVEAMVLIAGTYLLSTTVNGVTFSASGLFPAIGLQTIIFRATGIPTVSGSNDFTINTTPNCSFSRITLASNLAPNIGTIVGNADCNSKIISTRLCTEYSVTVGTNTYGTLSIAGQCWMTENLKEIPSNFSTYSTSSWSTTTPGDQGYWGYYNQDIPLGTSGWGTSEIEPYEGYLYQWSAAMNGSTTERAQGVCPTDWHIPSDCEWMYLENSLGMTVPEQQLTGFRNSGIVGSQLSVFTQGGTNTSGFSALLTGNRGYAIEFFGHGTETEFWSSSQATTNFPVIRKLENNQDGIFRSFTTGPANGYSVRCLKN
jgi:uncharacterized protein (TIGR02145 family)